MLVLHVVTMWSNKGLKLDLFASLIINCTLHLRVNVVTKQKGTTILLFLNWKNSLPTADLQMIGHALLSSNF